MEILVFFYKGVRGKGIDSCYTAPLYLRVLWDHFAHLCSIQNSCYFIVGDLLLTSLYFRLDICCPKYFWRQKINGVKWLKFLFRYKVHQDLGQVGMCSGLQYNTACASRSVAPDCSWNLTWKSTRFFQTVCQSISLIGDPTDEVLENTGRMYWIPKPV